MGTDLTETEVSFHVGVEVDLKRSYSEADMQQIVYLTLDTFGRVMEAIKRMSDKNILPRVSVDDVILLMRARVRQS